MNDCDMVDDMCIPAPAQSPLQISSSQPPWLLVGLLNEHWSDGQAVLYFYALLCLVQHIDVQVLTNTFSQQKLVSAVAGGSNLALAWAADALALIIPYLVPIHVFGQPQGELENWSGWKTIIVAQAKPLHCWKWGYESGVRRGGKIAAAT